MGVQDYDISPGNNTAINGIAITGSSSVKNGDDALRQLMADTAIGIRDGSYTANGYVAKAANYTVVAADRGKIIDCTAALTLSLTAAATLGTGFVFIVKANGGAVTINPNGTENINGASTSPVVEHGTFAIIACTGAAWHSLGRTDIPLRIDAAQTLTTAEQKQGQDNLGAIGRSLDAKSANYTVLAADNGKAITVDATGAARTVNLPAAATAGNGFKLIVKKTDASANTVTIDPNAAELVDGAATKVLRLQYQLVALICDGTAWHVISEGSIFARGSNANGEYIRYADGTQMCWNNSIAEQSVQTATGQVFRTSSATTWTFPVAFASTPAVSISPAGVGRWGSFGLLVLTSVDVYQMGAANSAATTATSGTAIGRWL